MSKSDDALMELYRRLAARNTPAPGSFTALSAEQRRTYLCVAKRRSRTKDRASIAAGAPAANVANVRDALADAALMILATSAPGVDQVRLVLGSVFHKRPGVPMRVEQRARTGRLRPKLAVQGDRE